MNLIKWYKNRKATNKSLETQCDLLQNMNPTSDREISFLERNGRERYIEDQIGWLVYFMHDPSARYNCEFWDAVKEFFGKASIEDIQSIGRKTYKQYKDRFGRKWYAKFLLDEFNRNCTTQRLKSAGFKSMEDLDKE